MTARVLHHLRHHRRLLMAPAVGLSLVTAACGGISYGSPSSSSAAGSGPQPYGDVGATTGAGSAGAASGRLCAISFATRVF